MDHAPHMAGSNYKMKVRVQVSGKTLNVQVWFSFFLTFKNVF
jgi:hypothetical protein